MEPLASETEAPPAPATVADPIGNHEYVADDGVPNSFISHADSGPAAEEVEPVPEGTIPLVGSDDAPTAGESENAIEDIPVASIPFTDAGMASTIAVTRDEPPPLAEEVEDVEVGNVASTAAAELSVADQRRLDIDAKQEWIAKLLHDCGCEGLLVIHPANFRWLTSGATPVGLAGRDEAPALFFNSHQRWLVSSATDSPRFFAEELDGLGFQLKEWHWSASREQLLADLVFGRKVASDQPFRECKPTGAFFTSGRRKMTPYEGERLADLGEVIAHSLAATARNFSWGETEDEIAGHLAHRLLRHGAEPVSIQINGDSRGRALRRRGHQRQSVERWCMLQVTARKFGLHATAARTVFRSKPTENERAEFEAALRARVAHLAIGKVGSRVAATLDAGRAVLRPTPFEHEWRLAPTVCLTGREPSEGVFLASATQDQWWAGWAAVWQERVGANALVDTYLLETNGWRSITPPREWPIRRAIAQGRSFDLADLLVRD